MIWLPSGASDAPYLPVGLKPYIGFAGLIGWPSNPTFLLPFYAVFADEQV